MFEYVSYYKIRDKIILSIIVLVVFAFLYTTLDKNDIRNHLVNDPTNDPANDPTNDPTNDPANDIGNGNDLYNTFTRSLAIQIFRFDLFREKGIAFWYGISQSILSYIIIMM